MHPVTGLSVGRIVIGIGAVAAPDLTGKLFRLNVGGNPQLPYMMRMFGSREIALGALTLVSGGKTRSALTAVGIAVDGTDAFAGLDAGARGLVSPSTSRFLTAPALGAAAAGLLGLVLRGRKKSVDD